jgi:hypothetical protein
MTFVTNAKMKPKTPEEMPPLLPAAIYLSLEPA